MMIKPAELLVISAVSFGAATLHNTPSSSVGVRPVGPVTVAGGPFAVIAAAQAALASVSTRERVSSTAACRSRACAPAR